MDLLLNFMRQKNIRFDISNIPEYLKCSLCHNILEEATYTTCGCAFCKSCIRNYLNSDSSNCPKCEADGSTFELVYERDVILDIKSNKAVTQLVLKCPYDGCNEKIELKKLMKHLEVCTKSISDCIYKNVGCTKSNMNEESLEKHMDDDKNIHSNLLLNVVCSIQSNLEAVKSGSTDIENLRNDVYQLTNRNEELCLLITSRDSEIIDIQTRRQTVHDEFSATKLLIFEEINRLKYNNDLNTRQITEMRNQRVRMTEEIKKLERALRQKGVADCQVEHRIKSLEKRKAAKPEAEKVSAKKIILVGGAEMSTSSTVSSSRVSQYEWKPTRLSLMAPGTKTYSDVFMLGSYRVCLSIGLNMDLRTADSTRIFSTRLYFIWAQGDPGSQLPLSHTISVTVEEPHNKQVLGHIQILKNMRLLNPVDYDNQGWAKLYIRDTEINFNLDDFPTVINTDVVLMKVETC